MCRTCGPAYLRRASPVNALANSIINYSTTAVLEDTLECVDGPDLFADFQAQYPTVAEYEQEL